MSLVQRTKWEEPKHKIITPWGLMGWENYLKKEIKEIEKRECRLGKILYKKGRVALFINL